MHRKYTSLFFIEIHFEMFIILCHATDAHSRHQGTVKEFIVTILHA